MALRQTKALERALQTAADRGDVSAILFVPGEPVAFRVDGRLERTDGDALGADEIHDIANAALGEERLAAVGADAGQVMTSCGLPGVVDGRLCVSRTLGNYSINVRILPRADLTDLAAHIGLPQPLLDAAFEPYGLVVVTGPADSGKTTTQYALLNELNTRKPCHICTVEYMIGMLLPSQRAIVQQREVGIDVPDCMAGIQAGMAQDLDVLFVGELRAAEDLEACIRVAYLGHLVITQLHLPTPEAAIARMIDLVDGTTRGQLARCLRIVAAQHLVPRADGDGKVAAFGTLVPDDEMRRAILEHRDVLEREAPLPEGCRLLEEELTRLVQEGIVSADVAAEVRSRCA